MVAKRELKNKGEFLIIRCPESNIYMVTSEKYSISQLRAMMELISAFNDDDCHLYCIKDIQAHFDLIARDCVIFEKLSQDVDFCFKLS